MGLPVRDRLADYSRLNPHQISGGLRGKADIIEATMPRMDGPKGSKTGSAWGGIAPFRASVA